MEARVIKKFFPELVTAIGDCIHSVSDQCLAKGLLSDSTYRKILQSTGTNDDKARILLLSILSIIEGDHTCFDIFLSALNESLPLGSTNHILSAMKNEMSCKSKEIVPLSQRMSCQNKEMVPLGQRMVLSQTEVSKRCITLQEYLFGLENSIRQHERACTEKRQLEEDLKSKSEEVEKLKHELKYEIPAYLIATTENRISASEAEIKELKNRMEEVESVIEDHGMKLKRGRSKMSIEMKTLFEQVNGMVHDEISRIKEGSRKREEEQASQLSLLAERGEQYKLTLQKKEEELRKKEGEYKTHLEETIQKEIEHRKTLKEEEDMHKI